MSKKSLSRLLRLVEHKHSIKLIHHRYTSHGSLFVILSIVGLFLFSGSIITGAEPSVEVNVSAVVYASAPSTGAVITSPVNGIDIASQRIVTISGTCPQNTYIVVSNNGTLSGTVNCKSNGTFSLIVDILHAKNIISARNYDNLNQSGPVSDTITVYSDIDSNQVIQAPVIPDNPSVIPGLGEDSKCINYDYNTLPESDIPYVSVVCIPRLFNANTVQYMGILVWGGSPPYALDIDLSNGLEHILRSLPADGYHRIAFDYEKSGKYDINLRLTDQSNLIARTQTAVEVNGVIDKVVTTTTKNDNILSWFKASVPVYSIIVAITLGFWGGDLFDRRFGAGKNQEIIKRATR